MALDRTTISISLSKEALRLLDEECQRRGWQRPQTLDLIILMHGLSSSIAKNDLTKELRAQG